MVPALRPFCDGSTSCWRAIGSSCRPCNLFRPFGSETKAHRRSEAGQHHQQQGPHHRPHQQQQQQQQQAQHAEPTHHPRPVHRGILNVGGELGRKRGLHFETHEKPGCLQNAGFIWTHGLTSSMKDEAIGGWPFSGVVEIGSVMPLTRYDARGHGSSDEGCAEGYTWPALGKDLVKMRKAWKKEKMFIGGTSMGAAASLYAALEEPSAFHGLILASPPTCYEQRQKFVPMYLENVENSRAGGLEEAMRVAAARTRPPIFMASEKGRRLFEVGWSTKMAMGLKRYCDTLEGAALSDLPPKDQLKTIELPTLILAWKTDVQHPVETAKMLHATLPNSELHIASTYEEIEDFPRLMTDFLRRCTE